MYKLVLLSSMTTLLLSCGSPAVKPDANEHQSLISALIAKDRNRITAAKTSLKLSVRNNNIINLYLLAVADEPYQLMSNTQQLILNYHHYNGAQQTILKQLLLWSYAHPIYRQETAKQVRLLQRESLLVAPSNIDFVACENKTEGCASILRDQVNGIITPQELTETLVLMANNDPCINLTEENIGGDSGNQCLASRKGSLKINLISIPDFLFNQWQALFDS